MAWQEPTEEDVAAAMRYLEYKEHKYCFNCGKSLNGKRTQGIGMPASAMRRTQPHSQA